MSRSRCDDSDGGPGWAAAGRRDDKTDVMIRRLAHDRSFYPGSESNRQVQRRRFDPGGMGDGADRAGCFLRVRHQFVMTGVHQRTPLTEGKAHGDQQVQENSALTHAVRLESWTRMFNLGHEVSKWISAGISVQRDMFTQLTFQ